MNLAIKQSGVIATKVRTGNLIVLNAPPVVKITGTKETMSIVMNLRKEFTVTLVMLGTRLATAAITT